MQRESAINVRVPLVDAASNIVENNLCKGDYILKGKFLTALDSDSRKGGYFRDYELENKEKYLVLLKILSEIEPWYAHTWFNWILLECS